MERERKTERNNAEMRQKNPFRNMQKVLRVSKQNENATRERRQHNDNANISKISRL